MTLTLDPPALAAPQPDKGHRCGVDMPMEDGVPDDIVPLTDTQKAVIKATAPVLAEHGETITRHFYKNMLLAHPELREVFSHSAQKTGHQAQVLAQAVHAYAVHIHDLTPLLPTVLRIAHKHASLHITPDQYAVVARHLIQAIVDVLGEAVTPEIGDAWTSGYWNLAKIFIDTERGIYNDGVAHGGWEGFRPFKIAKKDDATKEISHFYLEPINPADRVPEFTPGQYISVMTDIPSLGYKQARQYSLSDVPRRGQLRISVRRDVNNTHPGLVSNALHKLHEGSIVEVASPHGEFHLAPQDDPNSPLVLLAAGIGQTPLYPMLRASLDRNPDRRITYATVIKNNKTHAFKQEIRKIIGEDHPGFSYHVFHTRPLDSELRGIDYHHPTRLSTSKIGASLYLEDPATQYFLCGPPNFVVDVVAQLKAHGVPEDRIHYELFTAGSPA